MSYRQLAGLTKPLLSFSSMPTIFIVLLCFLILTIAAIVLGCVFNEIEAGSGAVASGFAGIAICLLLSFILTSGWSKIVDTKDFRVEFTPYRVIITGPTGIEYVWKDAFMVAHIHDVALLRTTIPHNAWGSDMTCFARTEAVFKDEVESK